MARRSLLVLALVATPTIARAEMPRTGFFMDLRLGGGASLEGAFFPTPTMAVGARFAGRVQLGGGLAYWRFAASGTPTVGTVLFAPDLAVDLFKSRDERVALFLGISLPMGALVTNDNKFAVGYRIALGVRYAPHPNFAFGVEAGGQGLFYRPGDSTGWSNIESIYAALVGTFYAGGKKHEARPIPVGQPTWVPPPPPSRAPSPDEPRAPPPMETAPSQ